MEAGLGGESRRFYIPGTSNRLGKKSLEWDLNDWKWNGDLFIATPLSAAPSDCRSRQLFPALAEGGLSNSLSSCSDETDFGIAAKGKGELEKRRRIVGEEDDLGLHDEAGPLTLKLGGHPLPLAEADLVSSEAKNEKGSNSNRSTCQVEGCEADLRSAKDYHRRHKVCEMHAKASRAMVGNVMQRFCQQCSRFHLLQEFDEGKRSCRRRLAGHNRRRRKPHPHTGVNGSSLTDDRASSYLLISLIRILSNLHSDGFDQSKSQDLLSHLLRNIASLAGSSDASNLSGLLQASQDMHKLGTAGTSLEAANPLLTNGVTGQEPLRPLCSPSQMTCKKTHQGSPRPIDNTVSVAVARVEMSSERNVMEASLGATVQAVPSLGETVESVLSAKAKALCSLKPMLPTGSTVERVRLKDFDLNDTYNDAQDCVEGCEQSAMPGTLGTDSPNCASWMLQDSHQLSPPQTSGHSDSTSGHSLCNSNGDARSRTDRIVFKLFGKDPNDFPLSLRGQVLDWLSHSPTDMESYIRPGCIILTVYLRLPESAWEELFCDLSSCLNRLLYNPDDDFWRIGWVYARVQHHIAFVYNGEVVLDTPLLLKSPDDCNIQSITPIAAPISANVSFIVKGFNLGRSNVRLLCAFEGRYLVPETPPSLVEGGDTSKEHDGSQCRSFCCSMPNSIGRGFIEVENDGLSSGFFPFVVAEEDVCSEIRMLESMIEVAYYDANSGGRSDAMCARNEAIDFLHEMGWLLRRSHLRSTEQMDSCPNLFPLTRFRWLLTFAIDREWCAVVKKLLDILFQGDIELGRRSPLELALSEDLLHRAVRKNCKSMVELLLRFRPNTALKETAPDSFLFKPDMLSPLNITPLHITASISGAEGVLDALTDDPGQLGIKAWNSVRDSTGFTPEDYARSRGFGSYIDLVQEKISKKSDKGHLVLDMPGSLWALGAAHKQPDRPSPCKLTGFQIDNGKFGPAQQLWCKLCDQQLDRRSYQSRSLLYRPVMISMVSIATVCVCVGLLLKGPPVFRYGKSPFRWEMLEYGWI